MDSLLHASWCDPQIDLRSLGFQCGHCRHHLAVVGFAPHRYVACYCCKAFHLPEHDNPERWVGWPALFCAGSSRQWAVEPEPGPRYSDLISALTNEEQRLKKGLTVMGALGRSLRSRRGKLSKEARVALRIAGTLVGHVGRQRQRLDEFCSCHSSHTTVACQHFCVCGWPCRVEGERLGSRAGPLGSRSWLCHSLVL